MRPPLPQDEIYAALLNRGRDVEISSYLTTGERNACIRAVKFGAGHLRAPGYRRKRFVFKLGLSPYGVEPPARLDVGQPWRLEPDLPHYKAGLAEGLRLAAEHFTYDSRFEQQVRTRYTAADDCSEPGAARDAFWFGVQRGYFA